MTPDEMIEQAFRNAVIYGGKRSLWVDTVEKGFSEGRTYFFRGTGAVVRK
jgi:hypothetical protein